MNDQKLSGRGRKRKAINNKSTKKTSEHNNSKNEVASEKKMKGNLVDDESDMQEKLIPSFGKKQNRSSIANVEKSQCSQSDKVNSKQKESVVEEKPNRLQMDEEALKCDEYRSHTTQSEELNLPEKNLLSVDDKLNHYHTKEVSAIKENEYTNVADFEDIGESNPLDNFTANINSIETRGRHDKDSLVIPVSPSEAADALDSIVNIIVNEDKKNQVGTSDQTELTSVCSNPGNQTELTSVCSNPGNQTKLISVCSNPGNQTELTSVCSNPGNQTELTSVCSNPKNQTEITSLCSNPRNHSEPTSVCPNPGNQSEPTSVCPNPGNQSEPTSVCPNQENQSLPTSVCPNQENQSLPTSLCSNPGSQSEPTSVCPNPGNQSEPTSVCPNQGNQSEPTSVCPNPGNQREPTSVCPNPGNQSEPTSVCPNQGNQSEPTSVCPNPGNQREPTSVCPNPGNQSEPTSVCPNQGNQSEPTSVCPNQENQTDIIVNEDKKNQVGTSDQTELTFVCSNPGNQTELTSICPNPENQTEITSLCSNPRNHSEPTSVCPNPGNQTKQISVCLNPGDQTEPTSFCLNPGDQTEPTSVCLNPGNQTEPIFVCLNIVDQTEPISICPNPGDQTEPTSVCLNPGDQTEPTSVCSNPDLNPSLIHHADGQTISVCLNVNTSLTPVQDSEERKLKSLDADIESCSRVLQSNNEETKMTSMCLVLESTRAAQQLEKQSTSSQCLEKTSILVSQQDKKLNTSSQCLETNPTSTLVSQTESKENAASRSLDIDLVFPLSQHDSNDEKPTAPPNTEQSKTKKQEAELKTSTMLTLNTGSSTTPVTENVNEENCLNGISLCTQKQLGNEEKNLGNVFSEIENSRDLISSSPIVKQQSKLSNSLQKDHCHNEEYAKSEEQNKCENGIKKEKIEENCKNYNSNQFVSIATQEKLFLNISKSQHKCGQKELSSTSNNTVKETIFLNKTCIMQQEDPFLQSETIEDLKLLAVQDESLCDNHVIQSDLNWKADTAVKGVAAVSDINLKLKGSQAINHDHQNSTNKELITETHSVTDHVKSAGRCLTTGSSSSLLKSTNVQPMPIIQDDTDLSDSQLCSIDLEQSQSTLKSIAEQTKQQVEGRRVVQNLIGDMQYLNKLVLKTKREIEAAHRKKSHQLPQMWKTNPRNSGQPPRKF